MLAPLGIGKVRFENAVTFLCELAKAWAVPPSKPSSIIDLPKALAASGDKIILAFP